MRDSHQECRRESSAISSADGWTDVLSPSSTSPSAVDPYSFAQAQPPPHSIGKCRSNCTEWFHLRDTTPLDRVRRFDIDRLKVPPEFYSASRLNLIPAFAL